MNTKSHGLFIGLVIKAGTCGPGIMTVGVHEGRFKHLVTNWH